MRSDHKYIMLGTPCNCKYLVLPRIGQGWEGPRFAIQSNVFKIQTAVTFYRVRVIVTDADHNCQKGSNATKNRFSVFIPSSLSDSRSLWRSHWDFLSCWHQPPVKLIIQMTHHTFSLIILTLNSLKESDKDLDCYWQIGKCSWCPCYVVWRQVKSTGGIKLRSSYWRFLFQCKQKRFMKLWNPILPGETCWHWFNMGHGSSVLDTLWLWLYMFLYFYKITNIFFSVRFTAMCNLLHIS